MNKKKITRTTYIRRLNKIVRKHGYQCGYGSRNKETGEFEGSVIFKVNANIYIFDGGFISDAYAGGAVFSDWQYCPTSTLIRWYKQAIRNIKKKEINYAV